MSVRLFCDGCGEQIDRDSRYWGVNDHGVVETVQVESEAGEYEAVAVLSSISTDEDFHACSPRCLGLFAMRQADDG